MNNEFLIFIKEIVIPLVFTGLTIYVAPVVKQYINDKQLNQAVKIAVEGVEQYMLTDEGSYKKLAAKNYILTKFNISDNELDMLIESAVFEMNK